MKLPDTIEGVYDPVYLKFQTSISYFLSTTESQIWGPRTQRTYLKRSTIFHHFWDPMLLNSKNEIAVWNLRYMWAMYMKLPEPIEGVYVSAYFNCLFFLVSYMILKVGFRAMHHNFELFSHFYCSIIHNIFELCPWNL